MHARGEFEVILEPLDSYARGSEGITLSRMSIRKSFRGDLEGKSQGEMLSVTTTVQGSAGYVAIEQVDGNLLSQSGTFVLQHYGLMSQGDHQLILEVVPDSGTGQLVNLSGKMTIIITDSQHMYEFDYSLG
jgi:hypothetical protein